MPTEQFANSAQTTLAAAIGTGDVSVGVADASSFPSSPQFHIRVDSELLLVTAVSGTTWTVSRAQEGTSSAAHASGAQVTQVLTAGFMNTVAGLVGTQAANQVFAAPNGTSGAPGFRTLVAADLPTGTGTVTSVNASGGTTGLSFSGGPVTSSGSLTLGGVLAVGSGGTGQTTANAALNALLPSQSGSANQFLKTDGANAAWHPLTTADLPAGTGTVTSVGLSLPSIFSVSGSPVTSSGTLTGTLASQTAHSVLAGPSSGGVAAPTFRALTAADLPAGTGTVTSIGLSLPSIFSVSGSPVTSSGTLTGTLASQSANQIFAAPNGVAGAPAFRALAAGDMPAFSGDVSTSAGSTSTTISTNAVTYAKMQQTSGLSVLGNAGTSAANVAAITGTTAQVLRVNSAGTALGFGAVDLTNAAAVSGALGVANGGTGLSTLPYAQLARITVQAGTPYPSTDQTGVTTLYLTGLSGTGSGALHLWDGSRVRPYLLTSDLSLSLSAVTATKVYDVFVDYNAGSPALVLGPAWLDIHTRDSTGQLSVQNGIKCLSGSPSKLWVGTIYASANGQTVDSKAQRFIWNAYNRAPRPLLKYDGSSGYPYNTNSWRAANGNTANQVEVVVGLPEVDVQVRFRHRCTSSSGNSGQAGVSVDGTTPAVPYLVTIGGNGTAFAFMEGIVDYRDYPGIGYHFFQGQEQGGGSNNVFYGAAVGGITLSGSVMG